MLLTVAIADERCWWSLKEISERKSKQHAFYTQDNEHVLRTHYSYLAFSKQVISKRTSPQDCEAARWNAGS